METEAHKTIDERLRRALFFCQMFNFGFGRAGIWSIHDPIADGFTTFADAHLVFTMFLVDKEGNPMGGFIYPILKEIGKEHWLDKTIGILNQTVESVRFEDYLRKWRNKLATHGDLSPGSLPDNIRALVLSSDADDRMLELLDELRSSVGILASELHKEIRLRG